MIKAFGQDLSDIKAFGNDVVKVMAFGEEVWSAQTTIPDYLCFTALESGTFSLTIPAAVTTSNLSYVEYSLDGHNWVKTNNSSSEVVITTPSVAVGGKVYWRGSGSAYGSADNDTDNAHFSSDDGNGQAVQFNVSGNIMSLLWPTDFGNKTAFPSVNYTFAALFVGSSVVSAANLELPATSLRPLCYSRMFKGCGHLTTSPVLPATSLSNYAYRYMYQNCTSLTSAQALPATSIAQSCYMCMYKGCTALVTPPSLPATTMANFCYAEMFRGCTSLTSTATLSATTLAKSCYAQMYQGCTSITAAPMLPATTLAEKCYYYMFQGCSNLSYVKCLATDISASQCVDSWLNNVSSTGTFIQASGTQWPSGASGIPSTWVKVEKRTMPTGYKQVEYLSNPNKPTSGSAPIIDTGFILDPSQDTYEFAVFPRLDSSGYLVNRAGTTYGEMPFANNSSPGSSTKTGTFYTLYRVNSGGNYLQSIFNISNGVASNVSVSNKVVATPQVLKIAHTSTTATMYLNGTQVFQRTGITVDSSDMTTLTAKLMGYNSNGYNWEFPMYYFKWWRNGTLIADYVPCIRESDNEVSFYDFVSQAFKVPTRTGFYVAGAEI